MTDPSVERILIVDDIPANIDVVCHVLESVGYEVSVATDGESALKIALGTTPDLILLDVVMPGLEGFEVCRLLKQVEATRSIPVIFLTARGESDSIAEGFQAGGVDYIVKPFRMEEVLARVEAHLTIRRLMKQLEQRNFELTSKNEMLEQVIAQREAVSRERNQLVDHLTLLSAREDERWGIEQLVGRSKTIQDVLHDIGVLQQASSARVLIQGESGTGKELLARAIHGGSPRAKKPFVPVNCSAVPLELAESLFFGHARGVFTGAERERRGYFEFAHGGTLFLDEIGDMPVEIQPKLLRVLEEGVIMPLGATQERPVDVRIISSSNQDLWAMVETGSFRRDLYFRLAQFVVVVSPLRERQEDIPLLARHFLRLYASEMAMREPPLTEEALDALQEYSFPGNVRELKNMMERAVSETRGEAIRPEDLHFTHRLQRHTSGGAAGTPVPSAPAVATSPDARPTSLEQAESLLIQRTLEQTRGNVAAAARLLGTTRPKIYRFLQKNPPSALPPS